LLGNQSFDTRSQSRKRHLDHALGRLACLREENSALIVWIREKLGEYFDAGVSREFADC
jgi:hypothetical protein